MLRIRVINPSKGIGLSTFGLIDTGADECALPARMASLLGYDLTSGARKEMRTGNGMTVAYSHHCKIEILSTDKVESGEPAIEYTIPHAPVDFMPNLHVALLGVGSFLNRFVLTVDYPNRTFSIRSP